MGLDMYLNIKRNLEFKRLNMEVYDGLYYTKYEEVGIGYWRKFNALHQFIVSNYAEVDDCKPIYLGKEEIKTILETLRRIALDNSLAQELMPSTSGFFFGGTQYDEWYFKDILHSIPIFELALKTLEDEHELDTYIIYQASW